MGLFRGMEKTEPSGRGNYFQPGKYLCKINKVFTKDGFKGDSFIVETEVLESDNEGTKPGTTKSWVVNFKHVSSLGNIKSFIGAAMGLSDSKDINQEVTEEVCDQATGEDQPLTGQNISLTAFITETKAGNDFTVHNWSPAEQD